jgi:heme oxygenase
MPESWMLARVKRETEPCHGAADADRMAVMSTTLAPASYVAFLSRIYGFEAPVEGALGLTQSLDVLFDLRGRTQIRRLRSDLIALGIFDPSALPRCTTVFPFREVPIALGWMFVLERNSLLHGLIERHLRVRLPEWLALAGTYLAAQERSAGTRWRELGEAMDRVGRNPHDADQIVYAARMAFRAQHGWYRQTGSLQRTA